MRMGCICAWGAYVHGVHVCSMWAWGAYVHVGMGCICAYVHVGLTVGGEGGGEGIVN